MLPAYKHNRWSLRKSQNPLSVTRPSGFQAGIFFCRNMVFPLLSWYNRCKNQIIAFNNFTSRKTQRNIYLFGMIFNQMTDGMYTTVNGSTEIIFPTKI